MITPSMRTAVCQTWLVFPAACVWRQARIREIRSGAFKSVIRDNNICLCYAFHGTELDPVAPSLSVAVILGMELNGTVTSE